MCRALTIIYIALFLIRSDDADAYKSYETKLLALEIQESERKTRIITHTKPLDKLNWTKTMSLV